MDAFAHFICFHANVRFLLVSPLTELSRKTSRAFERSFAETSKNSHKEINEYIKEKH